MKAVFEIPERKHGAGKVLCRWQQGKGSLLATVGSTNKVYLSDRNGQIMAEIKLTAPCVGLEWNATGETLAIMQKSESQITLWHTNAKSTSRLDTNMKDLSFLLWSPDGQHLAVGTESGNMLLYNRLDSKKIPILGRHAKAITCGCWNSHGEIALGSADKMISVTNSSGETIDDLKIGQEPAEVQFGKMSTKDGEVKEVISAILRGKTMLILDRKDTKKPFELAFKSEYESIITHKWTGKDRVLVGFSSGQVSLISTSRMKMGKELFTARDFKSAITNIFVSKSTGKVVVSGRSVLKMRELADLNDVTAVVRLDDDSGSVCVGQVTWTDDGQLLSAASDSGSVYTYLTKLPTVGAAYLNKMARLTSLSEVTVSDIGRKSTGVKVHINVEPSIIALGPMHLAVGLNNRAWFYYIEEQGGHQVIAEREYLSTVTSMSLNADYTCAISGGRMQLHITEGDMGDGAQRDMKLFPQNQGDYTVKSAKMTDEFCIFSTDTGRLCYFYMEDWAPVVQCTHECAIEHIYPCPSGTRVCFIDEKQECYVHNPVQERFVEVTGVAVSPIIGVLWDTAPNQSGTFAMYGKLKIQVFRYHRTAFAGEIISHIGDMALEPDHIPFALCNGVLTSLTATGKPAQCVLTTHQYVVSVDKLKPEDRPKAFHQFVALGRFREAWAVATVLEDDAVWLQLATTGLDALDVNLASRVYQHLGDVAMVFALDRMVEIEDLTSLSANICLLKGEHDRAQDLFLESGDATSALEMRRDLLHWEEALQLARKLAPEQLGTIALEYATQLEFKHEYGSALKLFEQGLECTSPTSSHRRPCRAGIARTCMRLGDTKRSVKIALEEGEPRLLRECASLADANSGFNDAGKLFEAAGNFDRAGNMYIKAKNWSALQLILPKISVGRIHSAYAKAREAEGKYKEALKAYDTAEDTDNIIRLYLGSLKKPDDAIKMVRETGSQSGAQMVAKFLKSQGDYVAAIEFLVLSQCNDDAFTLAQEHGQMLQYSVIIGDHATHEDYTNIAFYFEAQDDYMKAGEFFLKCRNYPKALKHFLKAAATNEDGIEQAIATVGRAKSDKITTKLIDFLMGEQDGKPKEAKWIFKLYMSLESYVEASRTAIIIAREEQNMGNYKNAHDVLFKMFTALCKSGNSIPQEMSQMLLLLHSYTLARTLAKAKKHAKAARMLIRVSESISKFPSHIVPILTSTVIECFRGGLKHESFNYAVMLMRPEYRPKISPQYKQRIEQLVRRRPNGEPEEEEETPCPMCGHAFPESQCMCPSCKAIVPYCIASGRHMVLDDWTMCPSCEFPAIKSEFSEYIEQFGSCPMCTQELTQSDLPVMEIKLAKKHLEKLITGGND